jgi:hypothetical protein
VLGFTPTLGQSGVATTFLSIFGIIEFLFCHEVTFVICEFPSLLSPTLVVEFHKVKYKQVIKPKKLNSKS